VGAVDAVARAVPDALDALAALAVAVRPDPAVAAARAARIEGADSIRHAHHVGELVGLRSRLRMARPTRRNRARLEAVCAELAALGVVG